MSTPQVPVPSPAQPPGHRFAVGAAVRVKAGTADADYPDIPLGGWAGVIRDIDPDVKPPLYLVAWTAETLAATHPVYRRRCERDDLETDVSWIEENVLEADPGGPLAMEQPTKLRPAPLDQDLPVDRALSVFNLTSDDELPAIEAATLARFHEHLGRRLHFPFPGTDQDSAPVLVLRLAPVERASPELGLLVEVSRDDGETEDLPLIEVDPAPGTPGWRDLLAYSAWLEEKRVWEDETGPPRMLMNPLVSAALLVVMAAALVGAGYRVFPEALLAMQVGAGMLGLLGGIAGSFYEGLMRRVNRLPPGFVGGLFLGLCAGAVVGAAFGTLVLACLGAVPGAILGTLLARFTGTGPVKTTFAWAYLGAVIYMAVQDAWAALTGWALGALAGVGLLVLGIFVISAYLNLLLGGLGGKK